MIIFYVDAIREVEKKHLMGTKWKICLDIIFSYKFSPVTTK